MTGTSAVLLLTNGYSPADKLLAADLNNLINTLEWVGAGLETLNVAGGADVTLSTASQWDASVIVLTGLLTASINLKFPDPGTAPLSGRRWLIINNTTGAFTVTVKTVSGTGITIAQGAAGRVYCDGTNLKRGTPDCTSTGVVAATVGPNTSQQHTLPAVTSDTVALVAATQTLTNKTLTSPTINSATITGATIDTTSTLNSPKIQGTVNAGTGLTMPALTQSGTLTFTDGINVAVGTGTGTQIGTSASQKLGFFGKAPAVQPTGGAATAGATYTATEQSMLQTAYNCLRTLGLLS